MAPDERSADERNQDEKDLINAEFESMVADLNLDQSTPSTYLDDLDAIDKAENSELYLAPRVQRNLHERANHFLGSLRKWWNRPNNDDSDGAVV